AFAHKAEAACNLIPQTAKTFDAAVGATNRPFAAPGEPVEVHVRPCDTASAGFGVAPDIADFLVTVVFTPSGAATKRAVVMTSDTDCSAVDLTACKTTLGAANVDCISAPASAMQVVDPTTVRFNFPSTDNFVGSPGDLRTLTGPAKVAVTRAGTP